MTKSLLIVIILIAVGITVFIMTKSSVQAPQTPQNGETISPTPAESFNPGASTVPNVPTNPPATVSPTPEQARTWTIEMVNNAFEPSELAIKAGDTVIFVNKDTRAHWPASDVHPIHTICPGFDSLRGLQKDKTYSHTFDDPTECPMHDHLRPSMTGKITVQ